MADQTTDFLKADFFKDYRALAQQSWEAWARQWQPGAAAPSAFAPPSSPTDDLIARSAAGLKNFLDWMQGAVVNPAPATPDWQAQLQQLFGGTAPAFTQAFAGLDQNGAHGFAAQWQHWQQAMQQGGFAGSRGFEPMAPLGYTREQQLRQQALAAAMQEYLQATARYQALIQRANTQGIDGMQHKLAMRGEQGQPVESLKALYDLWVDASEEAYAEIALSDEFREAYGAMVNAQMHVRQLQQQETERLCRELGMPTRSEVDSLGQRLQELRRELATMRRSSASQPEPTAVKTSARKPAAKAAVPAKPAVKPRRRAATPAGTRTRK